MSKFWNVYVPVIPSGIWELLCTNQHVSDNNLSSLNESGGRGEVEGIISDSELITLGVGKKEYATIVAKWESDLPIPKCLPGYYITHLGRHAFIHLLNLSAVAAVEQPLL